MAQRSGRAEQAKLETVVVDEFDALSIEVRVANTATAARGARCIATSLEPEPTPEHKVNEHLPGHREMTPAEAVLKKYPARTHARKVAEELGASEGLLFLPGEPSRTYEYSDMAPAFRQRRYFYYLSGADNPDCFATYDLAADHLTLWVPYVEPRQVLWYGRTPSAEEYAAASAVNSVRYTRDLSPFLHAYFHHHDSPATLFVLNETQVPPGLERTFRSRYEIAVDASSLRPAMDEARVVKTAWEIAAMRRANDVSSAAHRAVRRRLGTMSNEREVQALFEHECAVRGAKRQAYPVIAGAGENASTLHYGDNDQPLRDSDGDGKQFLVIDAGCEVACYASDITRTLPLRRALSSQAAAVYDLVDEMQRACVGRVRPGVLYYGLHVAASRIALDGLRELGIVVGDADAAWAAGTVAAFFPHGLGHHIGLETHDVTGRQRLLLSGAEAAVTGRRRSKRDMFSAEAFRVVPYEAAGDVENVERWLEGMELGVDGKLKAKGGKGKGKGKGRESEVVAVESEPAAATTTNPAPYEGRQKLRPGMVVTVEPGIYFCREYIEGYFLKSEKHRRFIDAEVLERYYHVGGVRIEDDILVTEDGYENLTSAPKGKDIDE